MEMPKVFFRDAAHMRVNFQFATMYLMTYFHWWFCHFFDIENVNVHDDTQVST